MSDVTLVEQETLNTFMKTETIGEPGFSAQRNIVIRGCSLHQLGGFCISSKRYIPAITPALLMRQGAYWERYTLALERYRASTVLVNLHHLALPHAALEERQHPHHAKQAGNSRCCKRQRGMACAEQKTHIET